MNTYYFMGNDTVGAYVERQLASVLVAADSLGSSDVIVTYFEHATALEDAYFDDGGIIKSASKKALLIDLSPTTPTIAREISAVATVNDLRPVEAPLAVLDIAANDAFAAKENFVCYVSGEDADVADAQPVLGLLAGLVHVAGPSGTAHLAKAAHTIQLAAQLISLVEADALRRETLASIAPLNGSQVAIEPLSDITTGVLGAIESDSFEGTYTVELMMADVAAALSACEDVALVTPQLEAALHVLEMIAVIGGADLAPTAVTLLYHDEAEATKAGLDWKRAEALFDDGHGHDHGHEHAHAHDHGFFEDYDDSESYDDYDDYDDQFTFGGFGVYSER